ncbi:hypothetical protein SCLCIDRAFT_876821 [Scleroderma citrinum Foug A]|uniref:DUF6533 domain-containing protein n=1 Tax=Scleroderma citrinum Foug A TaxID=1036808 RepID=A0A0C3DZA0_9AGAM|nr:hypothetical protein SCLCIDRAFT_876821 [Scleroderma citrinum Foug A]
MAIVVGSPTPADQIGPLEALIAANQLQSQTSVAVTVVLFYDFFLTLDQEIEHIWKHNWNLTSALYIFVRYFGTFINLTGTVVMSVQSTTKVSQSFNEIQSWVEFIIVWAVQVILQMRLYALYHCSKRLLVFMVTFFVAEDTTTMT